MDIGIDWRGTHFRHKNHLVKEEVCDRTNWIVLCPNGQVDIAFFPNAIPEELCLEMETVVANSDVDILSCKKAIIDGSWTRYGNGIYPVKTITTNQSILLHELNDKCGPFVLDKLKHINKNMFNKLDNINEDIKNYKIFAKYPTLALNVSHNENYNISKKPYRKHTDGNDIGLGVLTYFGSEIIEGGNLIIHIENLKVFNFPIQRRDLVFLNSKFYAHQVTKVTSGIRFGLVYFAGEAHFRVRNNDDFLPALPFNANDKELREERSKKGRKSMNEYKKRFLKKYLREKKKINKKRVKCKNKLK
ncbi:predicted protein [Naegleria gruberi]|uniref:Predicted protein n=1 Tax=Naegleria gruberi TaxID=5762 RepID=D2W5I5_NAEGR|nr:uncharacterized protein NAEGRDRAFT_76676 [Naegleria gruberi]EFC35665.1 predicted protein [Naegleria gruberi]|eukprot:XP_002668409.1 predicted protein [Naegleria gruberi strain NEG-M]